jgi:hypothetical protein
MQLIDTRELPVEENLWLTQPDNRLDHDGAGGEISHFKRCRKSLAFMPLCGLKFFILILRVKNSLQRGA